MHVPEEAAPPRVPAPPTLQTTTEAMETAGVEDEMQWASEDETEMALAQTMDPAGGIGVDVEADVAELPK